MSMIARFFPAVLLGIGVTLVSGVREQFVMPPAQAMSTFPQQVLGYRGQDVAISAEERRVAGMSDFVFRSFKTGDAEAFSVYVGYYDRQVQGKSIHSPKNCLPGAGWEILSAERRPMPGAAVGQTVNRVLLANGSVRALVYYWYQGRGRIESSEYVVKWNLLRDAALTGRTEESLVRIVVPVDGKTTEGTSSGDASVGVADALAQKIAIEIAPAVNTLLPKPAS